MSASHPKATESLRSSEMTLSANSDIRRCHCSAAAAHRSSLFHVTSVAPRIRLANCFCRAVHHLSEVLYDRRWLTAPRHYIKNGLRLRRAFKRTVDHSIHVKMSQGCWDEGNT